MKKNNGVFTETVFFLLALFLAACSSKPMTASNPDEIRNIAKEAYVYGFPLVLMDKTKEVSTAVPTATDNRKGVNKAPVNQFAHYRTFPDDTFKEIPSPNVDTLYSFAWLDLSKEPIVLSLPDVGDRYYLFPMLDGWTNVFFSPGTRTTGNTRHQYAIVGPQWKGKIPDGVEKIQAPTNMVWLAGRTACRGPADYAGTQYVQDRYRLTPLSEWGQNYMPPKEVTVQPNIDTKTSPLTQVMSMSGMEFYQRLAELMKSNPPAAADADILNRFTRIGLIRGKPFDPSQLSEEARLAIEQGALEAHDELKEDAKRPQGEIKEGWSYTRDLGFYGTNYEHRAIVAILGLGANLDEDAIYPRATTDIKGQPLNGKNRYLLHFAKEDLPPVRGFWSLTMYDANQAFVKNPIHRYALGDHNKLAYNNDGSLDIYIQNKNPGARKENNWLPAPKSNFNLVMRLYWPSQEILDGNWQIPGIQRIGAPLHMPKTALVEK